jgi:hypothetical protein
LRRGLVVAALALVVLPAAGAYALGRAQSPRVVSLATGDIARVDGTTVGCEAKRAAGFRELDCRRYSPLVGSYGALITMRGLRVVRYDTAHSATIVFTAKHSTRHVHTCG